MIELRTLVLGAAVTLAACGGDERSEYDIPGGSWSVRLVAAQHAGQPLMRVRIGDTFAWPTVDELPIEYRVRVRTDTGDVIDAATYVDAGSRRGLAMVLSAAVLGELAVDSTADEARLKARSTALANVIADTTGTTVGDLALLFDQADDVGLARGISARLDERGRVADYELELIPTFAGEELAGANGRHTPSVIQLAWGTPLSTIPGCDSGTTAEQCARQRVVEFAALLCSARDGEGVQRLPGECTTMQERLARETPEPVIACALPDDSGLSATTFDPVIDTATINGGHLLAGSDGDSAILHQLVHAKALGDGELASYRVVVAAERDFAAALSSGRAAVDAGDYAGARAQADKLVAAATTLAASEEEAAGQLLDTECRALLTTIDNADLFGYPDFGDAWLQGTIVDGLAEMAALRRDFYVPMDSGVVLGQLCGCASQVADWLDARPDVDSGMRRLTIAADPALSAREFVDGLAASYCGV